MPAAHVLKEREDIKKLHDETVQNYIWELRRQIYNKVDWEFGRAYSLLGMLRAQQLIREKEIKSEDIEEDEDSDDDDDDDDELF